MKKCRDKVRIPGVSFFKPVRSISAVIPSLNEANCIRGCIASLLRQSEVSEVIVADGGSTDRTRSISESCGAQVVCCRRKGRGFQICEGIATASADVILSIHADCRLNDGAAKRALSALNADCLSAGGAFRMAFSSPTHRLQLITFLNNLRAQVSGISFGDQGQFLRKEALECIGGFPEQMLMEDVELSLRLRAVGRILFLPNGVLVSPRRWESQPFMGRMGRVLHLFVRYLLMRRAGRDQGTAENYYRKYYQ
jgi:rSAM/selenodomain-associated transferase 2